MTTLVSWTLCGERDAALLRETLRAIAPIVDRPLVVWTSEPPRFCTCMNGPCDGECGYNPKVWEATEGISEADVTIRYFPWCDDFAAARNEALTCAAELATHMLQPQWTIGTCNVPGLAPPPTPDTSSWGLMLDADERVRCPDPAALRAWLSALPPEVDVVVCLAADGSHGRERLFRLPCSHKWVGRTHESIPVGHGQQAQAPASLIAWEERPKSREQLQTKFARDEALLAAEIAEHPDDPRWHAYRGASLAGLARYQEAVDEYRAASMLGHGEDSVTACYRAADLLVNALKRPGEAIAAAVHGMALNPTYAELPWIASIAAMHMGRPDLALAWARIAKVHGAEGPGRAAMMARVGHRFAPALEGGPEHVTRAAKAAMSPKDRVRCVVFSKDRPMQLDACLRSLRLQCADLEDMPVHVIVKASTQAFSDAYAELDAATPWATLHPETDFRAHVMMHLDRCEHVLFVTDDTVFVRRFVVGDMVAALDGTSDAIGVSLRLGGNCVYCYPEDRDQESPMPPDLDAGPKGLCSYSWPEADGDFGYPLEVSSSLYPSATMTGMLRDHHFANPNELEARLAGIARNDVSAQCFHFPERLLCPPTSVAYSVPCNRVQDHHPNRCGDVPEYRADALLGEWQEGYRIDVEALAGHTPRACHEEVAFRFVRVPRIEHVERPIRITVTSTGFRAAQWAPRCIDSVQRQTFAARHVYVAADPDTLAAARAAERGGTDEARGIGPVADDVETSGERGVLEYVGRRAGDRVLILDVGANRGAYTRLARDVLGARAEVYAFEPNPDAAKRIRGAASVFQHVLSDSEGTAELYATSAGSGMSSLYQRPGFEPIGFRVHTRTIDDVCAEMGIAHVDLLKIDVEGHELRVLRGARRMLDAGAIDAIQFEFGGAAIDARVFLRDFYRLLGDRYDLHRVMPRGIYPVEYSEREEMFVSSNWLATRRREGVPPVSSSDVFDGTGHGLLANILPVWRSLPDDEVIAWVDGDDWLATEHALRIVADAHKAGALATYGSFIYADGTPGFAAPADADVRTGLWLTTHLKTFRAGLVKRIAEGHLRRPDGAYVDLAIDQAVMLPVLEMAGERALYVPNALYVYNAAHSFYAGASDAEKAREAAEVRRIRAQRRYGRLTWM